ncbi:MAG: ABC transporter permease, partial [Prevotellaceae bacterium]|nr:ABC transporter permease [Prevotellaceae bacterium]
MYEFFIARRLYGNPESTERVSRPAVLIAMTGIAVGLTVMIIAVAIVVGFKQQVRSKIVGVGADIRLSNLEDTRSFETFPVATSDSLLSVLRADPQIGYVQRYTTKPGIVKTDEAFQGVILKGVGQEYDISFLRQHLQEGEMPAFTDTIASNAVLISRTLADKLRLHTGDRIYTYFFTDEVRARRLTVKGIYQTHLAEYDNAFLITDIYTVNRLYGWAPEQASGLELQVRDERQLPAVTERLAVQFNRVTDRYGQSYLVRNVEQLHPQLFEWLRFLDTNVWVILVLMLGVAGFTMISGLLILILERTRLIGLLKALGACNASIRRIFLWFSAFLIGKGMFWG